MPAMNDPTPCSVLFDVLKRCGQIKHNELAAIILSGRALVDGRSPASRAGDRSWVSRFVVHAPVGTLNPRYFADYGAAALRIANRLRSRRGRVMSDPQIIQMVLGEGGRAMDRALAACHQDARLYRNALERLASTEGHTDGERAEAVLVLFVAAGCSADARVAVEYTMDCARVAYDMRTSTPSAVRLAEPAASALREGPRPLGLMRVEDGYVAGDPFWVDPVMGAVIGALATGDNDITDVAADVSAEHARVFHERDRWWVEDLGSRNGTVLLEGGAGMRHALTPHEPMPLCPGDELHLAAATAFIVIG